MTPAPRGVVTVEEAARRLRAGGLVAFPTETVYGLGADATSREAVARLFALKGRPATNPVIVHVGAIPDARDVTCSWDDRAQRLADAFWPGPLTIVLPRADRIPDLVTAGGPTVGVRLPDHPTAIALLDAAGRPIAAPSANRSTALSPTRAAHVADEFPEALADGRLVLLDGGPCPGGIESTVLALDPGGGARLLRPGPIGAADLGEILGTPVDAGHTSAAGAGQGIAQSPGMLGRHYAPSAPLRLYDAHELETLLAGATRAVVLSISVEHLPDRFRPSGRGDRDGPRHRLIAMPADDRAYAAALYARLREADRPASVVRAEAPVAPEVILVERPPESGALWRAIGDRLRRAARSR